MAPICYISRSRCPVSLPSSPHSSSLSCNFWKRQCVSVMRTTPQILLIYVLNYLPALNYLTHFQLLSFQKLFKGKRGWFNFPIMPLPGPHKVFLYLSWLIRWISTSSVCEGNISSTTKMTGSLSQHRNNVRNSFCRNLYYSSNLQEQHNKRLMNIICGFKMNQGPTTSSESEKKKNREKWKRSVKNLWAEKLEQSRRTRHGQGSDLVSQVQQVSTAQFEGDCGRL